MNLFVLENKLINMRISFLFVFIALSTGINAQVEVPSKENNNTLIENSTNVNLNNSVVVDSTYRSVPATIDEESLEKKESDKNYKTPKRATAVETKSKKTEDIPVTGADAEMQVVPSSATYYSAGFESSKKKAAVQRTQRTPSYEQQTEMNQAVDYFQKNAPNSFEYHYFKYVSGNYDISLIDDLRKAEKIRPENADVSVQMAAYHIISNNDDSTLLYLEKLIKIGRLNPQVIKYAEDLLISVPENGTLITHGFDDTYAVVYQQLKNKIRTDIRLVSLDFMQSETYRNQLVEEKYILPESAIINIDYLKNLCALNSKKKIGLSSTIPKEYLQEIIGSLYITGLVYEYHTETFNNYYRNDELWNYLLKKEVINNATDDKSRQLSANYIPMLLQLRKVYTDDSDDNKWKDVDETLNRIGVQCNKYEQVQQLKSAY